MLTTRYRSQIDIFRRETYPIFTRDQWILFRNSSRHFDQPRRALFDSGAGTNFILRSLVDEMGLGIHPLPDGGNTYHCFDKMQFDVSDYVIPNWRLHQGQIWHQKYQFDVVEYMPDGIESLVGYDTSNDIGVKFRVKNGTLVAFRMGGKGKL